VTLDHDSSSIHAPCWNIVHGYASAYQAQLQNDCHSIDQTLFRKLERLSHAKKMWVWTLINSYLEIAIAHEQLAEHDTAVDILQGVFERCIGEGFENTSKQ
jgi:hypothetical protein